MNVPSVPPIAPGQLLAGKYRVERILGQGGMGVVLAAKHEQLAKDVAIKLLLPGALASPEAVMRFMREARAAVNLRSEHVARVLDVGSLEDGRPFIVMERLVGKDLGEVLQEGPLSTSTAVEYVIQACEAIAEAHAAGIVHRDLKPSNLFLTRAVDGRPLVKVLDFGISKLDPAHTPFEAQITRTAEIIGSPSYMSPEQLRSSRDVDARTDIWSLGVVLYELLTARMPFSAATMTELVLVVVTEPPPPIRSLRPDLPEALARVIERCLEKHARDRFSSVVELVQALEPFAGAISWSASERIRHAAGRVPAPPISSLALDVTAHSSPSLPAARASTASAWAETQTAEETLPAAPAPRRLGKTAVLGGAAALVLLAGAATIALGLRSSGQSPPPSAASSGEASMPWPPSRKDLPPETEPAPTPPAASSGAPAAAASADAPVPAASKELPGARKTRVPTRPKAPAPTLDDLDGIPRR